jgi:hypothetical protein
VACDLGQVLQCFQLIFPFKTWFFGICLNFRWEKSLLNQYLPLSESKSYQINFINPAHRDLSNNTKKHSNSSKNFSYNLILYSVKKSFNIQKLLHRKSKHHKTKPMHPSSSRAFQRDQECDLKHPGLVDLIGTNKAKLTNYLPS